MTMITPSYLGETIEYSSLHACRSTLEDPTGKSKKLCEDCADRAREQAEVAEASESVVQGMMGFKGRR